MLVEFGNHSPIGVDHDDPVVTYLHIPDTYTLAEGMAPDIFRDHLGRSLLERGGITRLPDHEALLVVAHPDGMWNKHGLEKPRWVWSDHQEMLRFLTDYWEVPGDRPADYNDTYYRLNCPPGVVPMGDVQANITQNGRDIVMQSLLGGQVGDTGQASASGATSLTTGKTYTTNQWAGYRVYASVSATQMVFGIIVSNTNAAGASVLTVDRWYTVATPGGAAGSTPSATGTFVICDGQAPAWFMGLSTSTTALAAPSTNTSLPSEITTASGGLIRKICPYAHSASAATGTLTPVFTANGSDSLPVTIGSIGTFTSMVSSDTTLTMLLNTLLGTTATLSASGDQLTITETLTTT